MRSGAAVHMPEPSADSPACKATSSLSARTRVAGTAMAHRQSSQNLVLKCRQLRSRLRVNRHPLGVAALQLRAPASLGRARKDRPSTSAAHALRSTRWRISCKAKFSEMRHAHSLYTATAGPLAHHARTRSSSAVIRRPAGAVEQRRHDHREEVLHVALEGDRGAARAEELPRLGVPLGGVGHGHLGVDGVHLRLTPQTGSRERGP